MKSLFLRKKICSNRAMGKFSKFQSTHKAQFPAGVTKYTSINFMGSVISISLS